MSYQHRMLGGIAAVTALVMLMSGGHARAEQSLTRAQLTALAESAALAGAGGFANAATDEDASAYAIHAAQLVIGERAGVQAEIIPSIEQRSVTVNLSERGPERRSLAPGVKIADVTATARFTPPDQPAKWAWASSSYFVAAAPRWRQAQSPPRASTATSSP